MNHNRIILINAEINSEKPHVTLERLRRYAHFKKERGFIKVTKGFNLNEYSIRQFMKEHTPFEGMKVYKKPSDILQADRLTDGDKLKLLKLLIEKRL